MTPDGGEDFQKKGSFASKHYLTLTDEVKCKEMQDYIDRSLFVSFRGPVEYKFIPSQFRKY